jgi:hypothetical protein
MSDGFPSRSCAAAILSHGEVVEAAGHSLTSLLVSGRGHKTGEVRTRCDRELKALWTMMRAGLSIVVPGSDGGRLGRPRER